MEVSATTLAKILIRLRPHFSNCFLFSGKTELFFLFPLENPLLAAIFFKFSNFLFRIRVYIYGMTSKMRKKREQIERNSLLFYPPFSEGFHIDPLTS